MKRILLPLCLALATPSAGQDGAALYAEHCADCHGVQMEGEPDWRSPRDDGTYPAPPHDETGHTWHHGDRMLFDYVKRGGQAVLDGMGVKFTSGMPAFGGVLTDAEIGAILDHIRDQWPEEMRRFQQERTEAEG